jgi:hypothetical protein
MNIIFAGIIGRHPYGGMAWCSLNYLLGLQRLGHRVWYLEDTGECNYDPEENTIAKDPRYALDFIQRCLEPFGLGDRWCYIDYRGGYHGTSRDAWRRICAEADLFLDLSGGCWFWRDEYLSIPRSAFIDSDPAFTQLNIAEHIAERGPDWHNASLTYAGFFNQFDTLFTFGHNIGTPACPVPTSSLIWEPTWQPVCVDEWRPTPEPPRPYFTTVMSWKFEDFVGIGGGKDLEFRKILDLPSSTDAPFELAVNAPSEQLEPVKELLRQHGWHCQDAFSVSYDLNAYRQYLRSSLGEFGAAKHTYVHYKTGSLSDRTECYLASGRPAVVQDIGFSAHLPTGEGLFAYRTAEEAIEGLEEVLADYKRHSRAARDLAVTYFDARRVLTDLLERIP